MDILKECDLSFQKLFGTDYVISAQKADSIIHVTVVFTAKQFFHLIGLNKLIDIPVLNNPSKQNVFERILNGNVTYNTIKNSAFIESVNERMKYFFQIESLLIDLHFKCNI